jgi:hypothetical protein
MDQEKFVLDEGLVLYRIGDRWYDAPDLEHAKHPFACAADGWPVDFEGDRLGGVRYPDGHNPAPEPPND